MIDVTWWFAQVLREPAVLSSILSRMIHRSADECISGLIALVHMYEYVNVAWHFLQILVGSYKRESA